MGAAVMNDEFSICEIRTAQSVDRYRAQRRQRARELWRYSTNQNKVNAVRYAEAGFGADYICAATGFKRNVIITLVTGE